MRFWQHLFGKKKNAASLDQAMGSFKQQVEQARQQYALTAVGTYFAVMGVRLFLEHDPGQGFNLLFTEVNAWSRSTGVVPDLNEVNPGAIQDVFLNVVSTMRQAEINTSLALQALRELEKPLKNAALEQLQKPG